MKVKVEEPAFDYREYLRSPEWQVIRSRILARDEERCLRCEGVANQVHHLSYARAVLDGYDDTLLVSLCGGCHHVVEFHPSGGMDSSPKRNTPARKTRILAEKDTRRDYPEPNIDMRRLSGLRPTD